MTKQTITAEEAIQMCREYMETHSMNQQEFAVLLEVKPPYLSDMLSGKRSAARLAQWLGYGILTYSRNS